MKFYIINTFTNIDKYKKGSLFNVNQLLHYIKWKHSEEKYGFIQKSIYKRI